MAELLAVADAYGFELPQEVHHAASLLKAGGAASPGAGETSPWELAAVLERTSIGSVALRQLEQDVADCARAYPHTPPDELRNRVLKRLAHVSRHLDQPQPVLQRQRLTSIAGLLAGLAGSLAFDLRDQATASQYFDTALIAADEADDGDLRAWILANRSLMPTYGGHPEVAEELLTSALAAATHASPSRRAWILAMQAKARAGINDLQGSLRALGEAERELEGADGYARRPGTDFCDYPRLAGFKGACNLLLGRAEEARKYLGEGLRLRDPADLKGRSLVQLDLAAAHLLDGEVEEACRLTESAVSIPPASLVAPIRHQALVVVGRIGRLERGPRAGELEDRVRHLAQ